MREREDLIREIVSTEWMMFDKVHNCGSQACCQDDWGTFEVMRGSQMEAWPLDLLENYCKDLRTAESEGRNLLCEKYAYMMEQANPEEYEAIRDRLPVPSIEKVWLTDWICSVLTLCQKETAAQYPALASRYRVVNQNEDRSRAVSFETYLRGELMTYSVETLRTYAAYIEKLTKEGKNLSLMILENAVRHYGYTDLEVAEEDTRGRV